MTYLSLYLEVEILCIIVTAIIAIRMQFGVTPVRAQQYFVAALIGVELFLCLEAVTAIFSYGEMSWSKDLYFWLVSAYYWSETIACHEWYLYFEAASYHKHALNTRTFGVYTGVFVYMHLLLLLINGKTHFMFTINEAFLTVKGDYYFVQFIFPFFYLCFSFVRIVHSAYKEENFSEKGKILTTAIFPMLTLFCSVLQLKYHWLPLVCVGVAVAVVVIFCNSLETQISKDSLTGLNNKREFLRDADRKIKNYREEMGLYFLMLDLDDFKKINDMYGHQEGDNALIHFADALKEACNRTRKRCTIARYGGDEFTILAEASDPEEITILVDEIRYELGNSNRIYNTPYQLQASIGVARYGKKMTGLRELLHTADQNMYNEKEKKKVGRRKVVIER